MPQPTHHTVIPLIKILNDTLKYDASITTGRMLSLIAAMLAIPVTLMTIGLMGLLEIFGASLTISLVFIAIGAAAFLLLLPITLLLRHVSHSGEQIVAKSPIFPVRIYSTAELYAVTIPISSPPIATLQFVDGSQIRYIPTSSGILFDVGEPTKRLIELAELNRETIVE